MQSPPFHVIFDSVICPIFKGVFRCFGNWPRCSIMSWMATLIACTRAPINEERRPNIAVVIRTLCSDASKDLSRTAWRMGPVDNPFLVGIVLQNDPWTPAGCRSTLFIQDDVIRNKLIDDHSNKGPHKPNLVSQACSGNASIREADQIHCRVFIKIPNILIEGKPVKGGQIAPLNVCSSNSIYRW